MEEIAYDLNIRLTTYNPSLKRLFLTKTAAANNGMDVDGPINLIDVRGRKKTVTFKRVAGYKYLYRAITEDLTLEIL